MNLKVARIYMQRKIYKNCSQLKKANANTYPTHTHMRPPSGEMEEFSHHNSYPKQKV